MVSTFSGPPAVHASVVTISLCFSCTTHASTVSLSLDFCWASQTQLTSVLDDGLLSKVPSTNHRSRSRSRGDGRSLYPWGGPPLIFLLSIKPSPDSHLSFVHQSQRVRDHVVRSIKVHVQRGKFQTVTPVMAEEYHFSDDEEGDALLDRAYDRWEQLGGAAARGPLFQFTMQPIGRRRRWRDVVERAQFNAQLRQLRDPVPGDNTGMALTEALHQAIETELGRAQRPAHHFVNFAITAHGSTHAYQTANFTVGEFLQRTARLDEMLATLAGKLNSNEAFNPDRGFQVDVVFVSMPCPGSGRRKQRNVGRLCLDRDNKKKQSIISIRNRDALCCARAIVTMRAHCHKDQGVDGFRDWDNLKRGRPVQLRQAQALHQQAGVAEGPCGLPELRQF